MRILDYKEPNAVKKVRAIREFILKEMNRTGRKKYFEKINRQAKILNKRIKKVCSNAHRH
jgi:hypothetical protein